MSATLLSILDRLEEQSGEFFALPVPLDQIDKISITTDGNDRSYLRLTFPDGAARQVHAITQTVGEDEGQLAVQSLSQVN